MQHGDASVRAIAGLVLKNNIRSHFEQIQPAALEYVKHNCLQSISDADPMVRSTAGIIITTIVARAGLAAWPQALPHLMELLDSPQFHSVDVSRPGDGLIYSRINGWFLGCIQCAGKDL